MAKNDLDDSIREKIARRKKEAQRKALRIRIIVFAVLLVLLIAAFAGIFIAKNFKGKDNKTQVTPTPASSSDVTPSPQATGTPDEKSRAIEEAKALATGYDYDCALELLAPWPEDEECIGAKVEIEKAKSSCSAVNVNSVPHIFFHSLINDDRGLRVDIVGSDRANRNNAAMATADEFDHIISQMYEAGYVLVALDDLCVKTVNDDGSVSISPNKNLMLPKGKKAFVLSEDDLSYYHTYGIGTQGYATKMVLDENGEVKCEYTDPEGKTLIGDYDVVPRLESFIKEHPDFSYRGARGTIALTGYNGVFGYRTNDYYKDINDPHLDPDQVEWLKSHPDFNWDEDVKKATEIADALKRQGWTFASHTYGHWNASTHTAEQLAGDHERWKTVNEPIVGKVDTIIFAFGGDIGDSKKYSADNDKFAYFKSQGFCVFCNVDGHAGWVQFGDDYLRTGRVAIDGFTMYQAMTEDGASHNTYGKSYELLGIHDVDTFFNKYRITPIESE